MRPSLQVCLTFALLSATISAHSSPQSKGQESHPKQSVSPGVALLLQRAEKGDASAQSDLGRMYSKGEGVPQDFAEAVKWYRMAAEQGLADAQSLLGFMYLAGAGVPRDSAEGMRWYRKAADQGYVEAQSFLALTYYSGVYKALGVPQDLAEAVKWYRKAAEQGDTSAQNNLGFIYFKGEGARQDYTEALKWFDKAAEQGDATAQFNLGVMYNDGKGIPQDYRQALKWYTKAAEQGDTSAQINLGTLLRQGKGAPQDYVRAHMWFNLAASRGDDVAQSKRDILGQQMTPSQLAEAQALARNWKPVVASERRFEHQAAAEPATSGSGFAVASNGIIVTNNHVVEGCSRLATGGKQEPLRVIAMDSTNDLALLQSALVFKLPAVLSENSVVRLGQTVVAAGFPLRGLLASSLNVTTGTVSALAGPQDDTRLLQVTAPVQPGNSGGPLLDLSGNVVGVIVSKLDAIRTARITGDIPQNVNFAIKGFVLRGFLESNGVTFRSARSTAQLATTEISERARQFTVVVECWK